jgi:hypothetical protein
MLQERQMTCFLLFVESFSPKENAIWRNCSHVVGGASNGNFGLRAFFSASSSSVEADLGSVSFSLSQFDRSAPFGVMKLNPLLGCGPARGKTKL